MKRTPWISVGHAAVDDLGGAGGECRLVGREVHRQGGDFFRLADAADGLARDEGRLDLVDALPAGARLRLDALDERGRLDGAGTDRVAADAAGDEVDRDRLRHAD